MKSIYKFKRQFTFMSDNLGPVASNIYEWEDDLLFEKCGDSYKMYCPYCLHSGIDCLCKARPEPVEQFNPVCFRGEAIQISRPVTLSLCNDGINFKQCPTYQEITRIRSIE